MFFIGLYLRGLRAIAIALRVAPLSSKYFSALQSVCGIYQVILLESQSFPSHPMLALKQFLSSFSVLVQP